MFYAVNNVFKFATNVQLIFKRRKFRIKKSKNNSLSKSLISMFQEKITQIFVRKKNVCYFCRTKTTFIVEKLKYLPLDENL